LHNTVFIDNSRLIYNSRQLLFASQKRNPSYLFKDFGKNGYIDGAADGKVFTEYKVSPITQQILFLKAKLKPEVCTFYTVLR